VSLKCPFQQANGAPKNCSDDCALIVVTKGAATCAIAQLAATLSELNAKIQK
jgi:hypothetical protein